MPDGYRFGTCFMALRRSCKIGCSTIYSRRLYSQVLSIERRRVNLAHFNPLGYMSLPWLHCLARLRHGTTMVWCMLAAIINIICVWLLLEASHWIRGNVLFLPTCMIHFSLSRSCIHTTIHDVVEVVSASIGRWMVFNTRQLATSCLW